jgi:Fe-S-cluster containining protein
MDISQSATDSGKETAISCTSCEACCCRLEVILMGDDDVPMNLTAEDRWGGSVMRRLDDGWCVAVDRDTMRCTIYERRPGVCRDYTTGDSECISEPEKSLQSFILIHRVAGAAAETS